MQSTASSHPNAAHAARSFDKTDLLYVDSGGHLDIFSYPQGKAVEQITSEDLGSDGICSDKDGNVYVPVFEQAQIYKFAHGATQPSATLEMPQYEFAMSCALDPSSGDLAVSTDNGEVGVFKSATSAPVFYHLAGIYTTWYCTYDNTGDLFVGGTNGENGFTLLELPFGGSALQAITLPAEVSPRLGIGWDGRHLVVAAEQYVHDVTLLRLHVSGSHATVVGKTKLAGRPNTIGTEFWIAGDRVVEPDGNNDNVGVWSYPAGGRAITTLHDAGSFIFALTISNGRKSR